MSDCLLATTSRLSLYFCICLFISLALFPTLELRSSIFSLHFQLKMYRLKFLGLLGQNPFLLLLVLLPFEHIELALAEKMLTQCKRP